MRLGINKTNLLFSFLTTLLLSTTTYADIQAIQLEKSVALDSNKIKAYAHKILKLSLTEHKIKIISSPNKIYFANEKQLVNSNKPVRLAKINLIAE
jgi:hypothetical protein